MATLNDVKKFVSRGRKAQLTVDSIIKMAAEAAAKRTVTERQRHAGKSRMRKLTKKQRSELARKGGLASAKQRKRIA